jgi:hypothetical protein
LHAQAAEFPGYAGIPLLFRHGYIDQEVSKEADNSLQTPPATDLPIRFPARLASKKAQEEISQGLVYPQAAILGSNKASLVAH